MEGHRSEEETDHDRTSAYHRDNGYHGAVQTQCIEICKVGGGEEYADEIQEIKMAYYRLGIAAKPEHVHLCYFDHSNRQIDERIAEYQELYNKEIAIGRASCRERV